MEINFIGDGEYLKTEIYIPKHPTDYEHTKIMIKPTQKLLELLKFLESIKIKHDAMDAYMNNPENHVNYKREQHASDQP